MTLKVYVDPMSEPSRAVIIFCKINDIDFEEVRVELSKRENVSPEYKEINPMRQVPAIVDGRFKLFESHAILIYLASAFPGVSDHWYPANIFKRAMIHSVLDWHHSFLRRGTEQNYIASNHQAICLVDCLVVIFSALLFLLPSGYIMNSTLAPVIGRPLNPQAAAEARKLLSYSLSKVESFWLKGSGKFLLGSNQPSIADISLACQIMQLKVLDEKDLNGLLGPHKKVQQWIEDTNYALRPHFDEAHKVVFTFLERWKKQSSRGVNNETESLSKPALRAKI